MGWKACLVFIFRVSTFIIIERIQQLPSVEDQSIYKWSGFSRIFFVFGQLQAYIELVSTGHVRYFFLFTFIRTPDYL